MLQKIWTIARNDITLAFRTPIVLIMAFVMPVILTAVLGFAIPAERVDAERVDTVIDTRIPLLLIDEDSAKGAGDYAEAVAERLSASAMLRGYEGNDLPATSDVALAELSLYNRVLVLPPNFSETLARGEPSTAQLYVDSVDQEAIALEQAVNLVLAQAASVVDVARASTEEAAAIGLVAEDERGAYFAEALLAAREKLDAAPGVVSERAVAQVAETVSTDGPQMAAGTSQSSPGQLVMFAMITVLSSAIALVSERNYGTLRRLVVSPLSRGALLGGKLLGPLLIGLIQMAVMILVGRFVFGVAWGRSPLALVLVVLAFDVAIVALAMLLSTLVRTEDQAVGAMVGFSTVAAALGGAWWPLEIMPETMQRVGYAFPTAWAMQGFKAVILRGAGVEAVMMPVLVLLGFAVVFFALGIWRFRYE